MRLDFPIILELGVVLIELGVASTAGCDVPTGATGMGVAVYDLLMTTGMGVASTTGCNVPTGAIGMGVVSTARCDVPTGAT